jgi:hypothetical protein
MRQIKGFKIERSSHKSAARWVDLLRSGKRKQAAAHVAEEQRQKLRATAEAIDEQLRDLARSRG